MRRLLAALIVGALVAAACGNRDGSTGSTDPSMPPTSGESVLSTTTTAAPPEATTAASAMPTTTEPDLTPRPGGSVVIADDQEPETLNPFVPGGGNLISIIGQTHLAGVYEIDAETLDLVPELVTELPTTANGGVTVNDDGTMTVRYQIRDEAVWSDGIPISGADFEFTMDLVLDQESVVDQTTWVDIVAHETGFKTFEYTLASPTIQYELLFPTIVPKHAVAGSNFEADWIEEMWPSAGPFVFEEWQKGDYLRLKRNENYWKTDPATGEQLPYLDAVEFRFIPDTTMLIQEFKERQIDVIQPPPVRQTILDLETLASDGVEVQVRSGPVWEHLNFQFGPNNRNPDSLNEIAVFRQAVAFAIDAYVIAQAVGWVPITSFVDLAAADGPWGQYQQDQAKAKDLLVEACAVAERDCLSQPPVLVFSTTNNADERPRIADYLQDTLGRVGIEVELELEDSQLYFGDTLEEGTWDVGMWAWVRTPGASGAVGSLDLFDPDDPGPDGSNKYRWGTPDSSVRDDAVDRFREVLAVVRRTVDTTEALVLTKAAEQILADSAVVIPVAARPVVGAFWADEIAGFVMNPTQAGYTWNIEFWHRVDL